MTRTSVVALVGSCVLWSISPAHRAIGPHAMSADEVLDKVAAVYAAAKSYRDEGAVSNTFYQSTGERVEVKPFKTAFVRPDRFRFEYSATNASGKTISYVVWRRDTVVQTWWDLHIPALRSAPSLGEAVGAAAGVSSGSSGTIPALLLPAEVKAKRITDATPVTRLDDAKLGTVECYRIQTTRVDNTPARVIDPPTPGAGPPIQVRALNVIDTTVMWIDKTTYLIRQMESHRQFPEFRTVAVTTYAAAINVTIPDSLLAFRPPAK